MAESTSTHPKSERERSTKARRDRVQTNRERTALADLPPDRQEEIKGRREAESFKKQQLYRPKVPGVVERIQLHSADIISLYVEYFPPCNEYALAIDYVAKERIQDRLEFNGYLQAFDDAISALNDTLNNTLKYYEEASHGGLTTAVAPKDCEANIQTRRGLHILRHFDKADKIMRMIQFLNIYGELSDKRAEIDRNRILAAMRKCVSTLRKVKLDCFKQIASKEALSVDVKATTTYDELVAARTVKRNRRRDTAQVGGSKEASAEEPASAVKNNRSRKRKKAVPSIIDPAAPASEALPNEVVDASISGSHAAE
ncbi:hypothetical protein D2T29_12170 [Sinirhodobacter populi]|uniref:DUF1845 domain-containing protein n=1 Tax=Paenirhodobacter populi TaxID=2306993 RepID=A0A443KCT1_9RHOB|nr:hypothetical protein [Sinirhodobacter populi]RWR30423.1 hypothetical protein D2T29_12170 [Sinirhodobacter populi]